MVIDKGGEKTEIHPVGDGDRIVSKVKRIQFRSLFAHHPNCNQYRPHVLQFGNWRLCLGCTFMYAAFVFSFVIDLIILDTIPLSAFWRYVIGSLLFIPTGIQMIIRIEQRWIKVLARFLLGMAIWTLLSAIYFTEPIGLQILCFMGFVFVLWYYSSKRGENALFECDNCQLQQNYSSCLIKYSEFLDIDGLEGLRHEFPVVDEIIRLKIRANHDSKIRFPGSND